jgi:bacteriocin biosynthesis cyclodehydratase domain-containing protein
MRPRLKRSIVKIEAPDGDVILMQNVGDDVRVGKPDSSERELLDALDGTQSREEMGRRFGDQIVDETLVALGEMGLLEDAAEEDCLGDEVRERYDRQLRYLADVRAADGPTPRECQEKLADSRVAVFGTGGLGGRVAWELASIGIGELRLLDGDRVELSNLNRQIQYTESQIGLLKVECLADRLRSFNSRVKVEPVAERVEGKERLAEWIEGVDLLIDAADWPAHVVEHWCNEACFESGVPYIGMSHFPPVARIGPLYVPGVTGCFSCQEIGYRREYPLFDMAIEQRRGQPSPAPTLGPACGATAGLVATEVMHHLTGVTEPMTLGRGYALDLRTMAFETYEVTPEPGCPVCSAQGGPVGVGAAA